jgi:hypothetical protein
MSKLLILRERSLNELQDNLPNNILSYSLEESWLTNYFQSQNWYVESKLPSLPDDLLLLPNLGNNYDLQNSQRIYEALSGITLSQASDPRLWTYLTHIKFWHYMKKRWPVDKNLKGEDLTSVISSLKDRYFLIGDRSRGLTRNGVARLWWSGYICQTVDNNGGNNFDLAIPLFLKQDIYSSFMERAYSKNKMVMRAILSVLLKKYQEGKPFDDRQKVRALAKYLVMVGGVTILDAIEFEKLSKLISAQVDKLNSA